MGTAHAGAVRSMPNRPNTLPGTGDALLAERVTKWCPRFVSNLDREDSLHAQVPVRRATTSRQGQSSLAWRVSRFRAGYIHAAWPVSRTRRCRRPRVSTTTARCLLSSA